MVIVALIACSGNQKPMENTKATHLDSAYIQYINAARKEKDKAFAMSVSSPFHDAGPDFTGLKYFSADLKWRVKAVWDKKVAGKKVSITDTKGNKRNYEPAGVLNFELQGKKIAIPAYFEDLDKKILFVMFRDLSNGKTTYGGGRYMEFRVSDELWLDFNQAYNPFCHYNHNYACPMVPLTHKLDLNIEAGEKLYSVN
jgi:uncharacterized protein (DUF1684 family)